MAEVTNELMYELLKKVHQRMDKLDFGLAAVKAELVSIRGHMVALQSDIHNIYGVLARHDGRLDRIERRLELRQLAEGGSAYDPIR